MFYRARACPTVGQTETHQSSQFALLDTRYTRRKRLLIPRSWTLWLLTLSGMVEIAHSTLPPHACTSRTKYNIPNIGAELVLPDTSDVKTNHPDVPPLFIVNWQMPTYSAPIFNTVTDGCAYERYSAQLCLHFLSVLAYMLCTSLK
jgi:hypothetical protein